MIIINDVFERMSVEFLMKFRYYDDNKGDQDTKSKKNIILFSGFDHFDNQRKKSY